MKPDSLKVRGVVTAWPIRALVFVFGSFMLEDLRTIKVLGLVLAAAVAIDATVIRMLPVPATMELLGDKNWWIPKWLDRTLPNLVVEPDRSGSTERRSEMAEHAT